MAATLYRQMLCEARRFAHYNMRDYALRRVKLGFDMNRKLEGDKAAAALEDGRKQLVELRRQVTLYNLYPPPERSVMEAADNPFLAAATQVGKKR